MGPFLQGIVDRPTSHKVIFWVISVALTLFLFWQYFYSGLVTEQEELTTRIAELNSKISHERRLVRELSKFREEVKQLDIKLKIVLRELPDKREIPNLLDSISNRAKDAGLEVTLFRPQPEAFKEFYVEVPVFISVEGTFHQVATFFDEVGRMPRIVNISQISLKEPKIGDEKVLLKSDSIATTFRYLEESERVQTGEGEEAGRRRRR